jgi:metallo-beta-lactamase family protein
MISLEFHGAAQTVTGSKYLVRAGRDALLIDCGMFQGLKELRLRNWEYPDFDLADLPYIVLTHAHTDHTAYLPRLHKLGFRGTIYCSAATAKLTEIILLDAAELQEEDAQFLNKKGLSKHKPAQPLFDVSDAKAVLKLLKTVSINQEHRISPQFVFTLHPVGHILGACSIHLTVRDDGESRTLYFSGDVGRYDSPLLPDPAPPVPADYLVIESTYGDRLHGPVDSSEQLAQLVDRIVERRGILLIPAFAVGRAQQVVFLLHELQDRKRIPLIPIHVDSPMALDATEIFYQFPELHRLDFSANHTKDRGLFSRNIMYHRTREDSQAINAMKGPRVVISSSGMLTGGRILHHLIQRMGHPENIIALAGFQSEGTRGRTLLEGRRVLKIHGREHVVRADVAEIGGLSGHGDYSELMRWVGPVKKVQKAFVTHGEPAPAAAMAERLRAEMGFDAIAPKMGEVFEL